jgi:hypothetical protein
VNGEKVRIWKEAIVICFQAADYDRVKHEKSHESR